MNEKLFTKQLSVRIPDELLEQLNNNIEEFLPDLPSEQITIKHLFEGVVNMALGKTISKTTLDKAVKEAAEYKRIQDENRQTIERIQTEYNELQTEYKRIQSEYKNGEESGTQRIIELTGQLQQANQTIEALQLNTLSANQVVFTLTPLELAVANLIRERMSAKLKREVSLKEVVFGTWWIYNITQEWEFSKIPFLVSPSELKQLSKQYPADE